MATTLEFAEGLALEQTSPSLDVYLRGGLLPRPPPEGLPVFEGAFSR